MVRYPHTLFFWQEIISSAIHAQFFTRRAFAAIQVGKQERIGLPVRSKPP
jgi:hypothetical protein